MGSNLCQAGRLRVLQLYHLCEKARVRKKNPGIHEENPLLNLLKLHFVG